MRAFSKLLSATAAAGALMIAAAPAHAVTNVVKNGSFEQSSYKKNTQFGAGFGGQGVTFWTGGAGKPLSDLQFYFIGGTQSTVDALNQFGDPKAYFFPNTTLSPDGGNFVALDGDPKAHGEVSQTIGNLKVGKKYTLTFDWAASQLRNRSGATTEELQVSFGSQVFNTAILNNASHGFTGWKTATFNFTPTTVSQTLSFLSKGTPKGLPPIALLDGVSLTTGVPEPASWAMMLVGFGGVGVILRRRRRTLAAA